MKLKICDTNWRKVNGLQQQNIIDIVGKNYLALRIESLFAERGIRIRNIMVSLFNLFFQIHNIQQLKLIRLTWDDVDLRMSYSYEIL